MILDEEDIIAAQTQALLSQQVSQDAENTQRTAVKETQAQIERRNSLLNWTTTETKTMKGSAQSNGYSVSRDYRKGKGALQKKNTNVKEVSKKRGTEVTTVVTTHQSHSAANIKNKDGDNLQDALALAVASPSSELEIKLSKGDTSVLKEWMGKNGFSTADVDTISSLFSGKVAELKEYGEALQQYENSKKTAAQSLISNVFLEKDYDKELSDKTTPFLEIMEGDYIEKGKKAAKEGTLGTDAWRKAGKDTSAIEEGRKKTEGFSDYIKQKYNASEVKFDGSKIKYKVGDDWKESTSNDEWESFQIYDKGKQSIENDISLVSDQLKHAETVSKAYKKMSDINSLTLKDIQEIEDTIDDENTFTDAKVRKAGKTLVRNYKTNMMATFDDLAEITGRSSEDLQKSVIMLSTGSIQGIINQLRDLPSEISKEDKAKILDAYIDILSTDGLSDKQIQQIKDSFTTLDLSDKDAINNFKNSMIDLNFMYQECIIY